jgi:CubicO group peptidase (beta-lactamase class C family)
MRAKRYSAQIEQARERIRAALVEQSLPSLAVAVAKDGEVIWEEGFGWADRENRIPATEHTVYSLASISKPITATAAMILAERGRIDLDKPINDYLGAAKLTARVGRAEEATVRRVANHTAGLPLHCHFFYADEPYAPPPMEETIRRYGNLVTAPGERYQYSNLGYGLLGYVVEKLSGRSLAEFLRTEVFLPLGMLRSALGVSPELQAYRAARYGSDGVRYPDYDFDHPGGSAVYASAHDLLRFALFHLNQRLPDQKAILSEAAIDAMQDPRDNVNGTSGYAFGWGVNTDDCGYVTVGHSGLMGGVNTVLRLIPSEKLAIVALANACCRLPFTFAEEAMATLLPAYAERRAQKQASEPEPEKPEPFAPPRALVGEWRGAVSTYRGDIPCTLTFFRSGDVHAQLGAQLKTLVNEPKAKEETFRGIVMGDIGTEDVNRRPYRLHLDLKRRGRVLNGALNAITHLQEEQGGAPGRRMGNALAHWIELKKH